MAGIEARRALRDAARRDRHGQDVHDGERDRAPAAPDARDRAQQDAGRAALQRVPRVLRRERGRVLRLVLRLLPARGLPARLGHVHREGLVDQRRHRPSAPRGDVGAAHPARRRDRRLRLVHLRPRLAGRVPGADGAPADRGGALARADPARARRHPVPPQRHGARPRALPCPRRRDRGAARLLGDRLPRLPVRRRGRDDHPLRPHHGRGLRAGGRARDLPGDALRDDAPDDRARDRGDQRRARRAPRGARGRRQDARGPPAAPAHRVRHGDDARARLLQRHRELLADPRRARAGHRAVHAARLLPRRLPRRRRRVAPDDPADRRHARGRPLAQVLARRLRLPAALCARQPPAQLRGVPRSRAPGGARLGDPRRLRDARTRRRSSSRSSVPRG